MSAPVLIPQEVEHLVEALEVAGTECVAMIAFLKDAVLVHEYRRRAVTGVYAKSCELAQEEGRLASSVQHRIETLDVGG